MGMFTILWMGGVGFRTRSRAVIFHSFRMCEGRERNGSAWEVTEHGIRGWGSTRMTNKHKSVTIMCDA